MQINIYKVFRNVTTSLWLIPVLCVMVGIVISFSTIAIDRAADYQLVPPNLVGGPEAALEILTTVATSMVNLAVHGADDRPRRGATGGGPVLPAHRAASLA